MRLKRLDRKALAVLLRRAGLSPTERRIEDLIAPARYIEAAGQRLARTKTANLSPVGTLWDRPNEPR